MKITLYIFFIFITASKFAICATKNGLAKFEPVEAQAQLVESAPEVRAVRMKESIYEKRMHDRAREIILESERLRASRPDRDLSPRYILDKLSEAARMLQVVYGNPGDEMMKPVDRIRDIQKLADKYPDHESIRSACAQLIELEKREISRIMVHFLPEMDFLTT
jgi:hypothetical protein